MLVLLIQDKRQTSKFNMESQNRSKLVNLSCSQFILKSANIYIHYQINNFNKYYTIFIVLNTNNVCNKYFKCSIF